ncbi:MAG TPA: hypothetical protein VG165_09020 [Solirubrobacteraceae bacterium]|nr:hypothetical protein [Solirubrobacteraceae bacterium]
MELGEPVQQVGAELEIARSAGVSVGTTTWRCKTPRVWNCHWEARTYH